MNQDFCRLEEIIAKQQKHGLYSKFVLYILYTVYVVFFSLLRHVFYTENGTAE